MLNICNKIIEYSFYALFFLVPLVFTSNTSELFEFNKLWLTFGISLIIFGAWTSKMIVSKRFFIQKTPLDLFIFLFLLSQIISTLFSLDMHVSIWGYYSRFNGGLLSITTYIFLYYAFVSNVTTSLVRRSLLISIFSGLIVALWGLPSHFGYDPTCLVFRGTFDVSCWTEAFQPTIRIFSTLGQPDWLAAYLSVLIPLTMAYVVLNMQTMQQKTNKQLALIASFLLLVSLFTADLFYTRAKSGLIGNAGGVATFLLLLVLLRKQLGLEKMWLKITGVFIAIFLILIITVGASVNVFAEFAALSKFLPAPKATTSQTTQQTNQAQKEQTPPPAPGEIGGTDSGTIRSIVWEGAIDIWKDNPLFGTGVETFAFAYYRYRPVAHNMTSEWDYLYNKAHNEYLNYLATTGAFGLGTYLLLIAGFLYIAIKRISNFKFQISNSELVLSMGLLAGFVSILISNFFGFSVVIINIYFFLIPAFIFILFDQLDPTRSLSLFPKPWGYIAGPFIFKNEEKNKVSEGISIGQWIGISVVLVVVLFELTRLIDFWVADTKYYLGSNLDKIGQYQQGYNYLSEAIAKRGDEPVFKDEMSSNNAVLAAALFQQKDATTGARLAEQAVSLSNEIINDYPNNTVFWKTRVRIMYSLAQVNSSYMPLALQAIEKTRAIAPTDAKISYNLGVLYGQSGQIDKGIKELERTIKLKPDYRDAYFALGLFYHEKASNNGRVVDAAAQQKAVEYLHYILDHLGKDDKQILDTLKSWGAK